MKYIYTGFLLIIFLLCSILLVDRFIQYRVNASFKHVKIGDSKATVAKLLGEPNKITSKGTGLLFLSKYEQWIYGGFILYKDDFPYIGILPKLRMFGADNGDRIIHFDDSGNVVKTE